MAVRITDQIITSDRTAHAARSARGHEHAWQVSWLPGWLMNQNTASTAMMLADSAAATGLRPGHRLWPHIQGRAAGPGLTAPHGIALASAPPETASGKEPASPPDREAAGP